MRFATPPVARSQPAYKLPAEEKSPGVEIIYSHSNTEGDPIDDAVKRGAKAIVLAGEGDGNTLASALDALSLAAKSGIVVIRSTRVGSSFVNRNVEVDDSKMRFVAALDLNPQKSRVLATID